MEAVKSKFDSRRCLSALSIFGGREGNFVAQFC